MIINDLQRLRWQILDEALRDPVTEYFMGERTEKNETGNTRSLIYYVNKRLKAINRKYSCSKRMLQNDVSYFKQKGARLEPSFRRGHKRILRYINLEWKNPLLRPAPLLMGEEDDVSDMVKGGGPLMVGEPIAVTLRMAEPVEPLMQLLGNPKILQRQANVQSSTITATLELNLSPAIRALLLGFGSIVEVLAPSELREDFRQETILLQKIYNKENTQKTKKKEQLSLFDDLF